MDHPESILPPSVTSFPIFLDLRIEKEGEPPPTKGSILETIKSRLEAGKEVHIFAIGAIPSPKLIEMAALTGGYHGVWIDEEHAALSLSSIELLALACRSVGLDSYVRLAPVNYASIMRPMEAGVGGIMAAQVRSVQEVKQIVRWAKFPPIGERGINVSNYEGEYATRPLDKHIEITNRDRWLSVQIETLEALEAVEEIAAVHGVDHLFVGPADLSVALGVPGDYLHAKCVAALERVSNAVRQTGKSWGILARGAQHADRCRSLGCQLFAFGTDLGVAIQGFKAFRAMYPEFFK
jgi:2-dehydro-3-deoxyglucarate aldolase/4-hydroxy-2-oxoheptanedioate aldolase